MFNPRLTLAGIAHPKLWNRATKMQCQNQDAVGLGNSRPGFLLEGFRQSRRVRQPRSEDTNPEDCFLDGCNPPGKCAFQNLGQTSHRSRFGIAIGVGILTKFKKSLPVFTMQFANLAEVGEGRLYCIEDQRNATLHQHRSYPSPSPPHTPFEPRQTRFDQVTLARPRNLCHRSTGRPICRGNSCSEDENRY